MEVIAGWTHRVFPLDDPSRIGEARRHAALLASEIGLDETEAGRLALVVTELGTNLQRHATGGQLLLAARPAFGDVEVVSIDAGPGIAEPERAMQDGYSTGSGSPGTGLGALQRLATEFDLHSGLLQAGQPGGTLCVARVRRAGARAPWSPLPADGADALDPADPGARWLGAISICAPRETVNGDGWALACDAAGMSLLVADGLGHGPEAGKASRAACASFAGRPFDDAQALFADMHAALQATRGAAVNRLRLQDGAAYCVGAGNVAARILSGVSDRSMLTQHGTVGLQMRRLQEARLELPAFALAVVHSDGIETRWDAARLAPLLHRDPVLIAAWLLREHTRGRDDVTVVVLRPPY